MKQNYIKLLNRLIFAAVASTALFLPLFFLPQTAEFFEFNKFTLLLAITLLGLIAWSARMVLEKKFVFTRTPFDIPLLLLFIAFLLATLTSIDGHYSLFGANLKPWPSFFSLAVLIAFYFLAVSNLKTKKEVTIIVWVLITSTVVAAIMAIFSYFGFYFGADFAQVRSFSPAGNITSLATLIALTLPLTVSMALIAKTPLVRLTTIVCSAILLFSLVLINFAPAYFGIVAALVLIAATAVHTRDKTLRVNLAILAGIAALFLAMRFVPTLSTTTLYEWISDKDENLSVAQLIETPKETRLPQRAGWEIATATIGKRPFLGSGPATFGLVFTQLKPRYLNSTDLWSLRFNSSSSEFAQIIAEVGVVGTLAYLVFLGVFGRFLILNIRKKGISDQGLHLASGATAFLVLGFFTTYSFLALFVFFLVLTLIMALSRSEKENIAYDVSVEIATLKNKFAWFPLGGNFGVVKTEADSGESTKSQVLPALFLIATLLASFFAINHQIRAWRGEYFYRQALLSATANDGNKTIDFLQKAARSYPAQSAYHRTLSQTAIDAALNLGAKPNPTDAEKQLLLQLVQVAIDQGKIASGYQILPLRVPGISSANASNWETLANAYQAIIGAIGGSETHAVNALIQAVNLDPQNPLLHDRLGILYQRLGNSDLAQRKFEDAIVTKPDLGVAHYHLSQLLISKEGDAGRIVNELTLTKRFLPAGDQALGEIEKQLSEYNKKLEEAQKQTNQKAVPAPSPSPTPSPKPSPSPSPSPKLNPSPSPSPSPSPAP